jgi:maltooligosyltrehalose trehalohydrolase
LEPWNFVTFLQNHDQVANSLRGLRVHQLTSPGRLRALTALMLLSPQIPLLFQGQEFGASAPFFYFADHRGELQRRVSEGRRSFLQQFPTISCPESDTVLVDPASRDTFLRSKLAFEERERHAPLYRLHADLLRLRREQRVSGRTTMDGAVLSERAFVLRFFADDGDDRLLIVNLGADLWFHPAPEPLLAPPEGRGWKTLWSSEAPDYGGCGTPPLETSSGWLVPGEAAVLLRPNNTDALPNAKFSEKD